MRKTRVIVQYSGNENESIFLRGEGIPGLSWEKGILLKHGNLDEWVWETDANFSEGKFKVLINDKTYEIGENHPLYSGASIRVNPKFSV